MTSVLASPTLARLLASRSASTTWLAVLGSPLTPKLSTPVRVLTEKLLGTVVVGVILEAQVRYPCDFGVLYEPATGCDLERQDAGKGGL